MALFGSCHLTPCSHMPLHVFATSPERKCSLARLMVVCACGAREDSCIRLLRIRMLVGEELLLLRVAGVEGEYGAVGRMAAW